MIIAVGLVWVWASTRILGGQVNLVLSLKATGLGLVWPGIVATAANLFIVIWNSLVRVLHPQLTLILEIVIVLWLLLVLGACIRGLTGFRFVKVLAAVLLLPLVGAFIGVVVSG